MSKNAIHFNHFSLIILCLGIYQKDKVFLQKWQFLIENAQVLFMTKCNFICRYSSFLTYWACKTISQKRVAKIMRFFFSPCVWQFCGGMLQAIPIILKCHIQKFHHQFCKRTDECAYWISCELQKFHSSPHLHLPKTR